LHQHLFSRFLSGSAWASVGVAEDQRLGVYECLRPAFEELFDQVEEHILDLLLEPWTLLVTRDTLSYQTVANTHQTHPVLPDPVSSYTPETPCPTRR
jgi:hypothetical protein